MRPAVHLIAAISGLALVFRAVSGPLERMHSPMNAESVFALAILTLAILTSEGGVWPSEPTRLVIDRLQWWAPLSIFAIVGLMFAGSAHDYFLSDDFVMLRHAHEPFTTALYTYGGGDGMFRPLIYESFRLVLPWAGEDPFRWHLTGLAIHAVNSILVLLLAQELALGRFASWFAGALFAIHGTRPETAVWITGRFDLISTFFVLAALVLFLRGYPWIALMAMIAGILSKESAYACPLLLLLLAPKRWKAQLPFFAAAAGLFFYRFWLFGNIGGYKTVTGEPQALSVGLVSMAKALALRLWAVLFFPINWSVQPELWLGLAMLGFVVVLLWMFFPGKAAASRQTVVVAIAFVIVAALPPVQQLLIGADLQKARYVYLPSVGFCLLFAALFGRQKPAAAVLILAFEAASLHHNLKLWHDASVEAKAFCQTAAEGKAASSPPPPNSVNGVYLFQNGLPECIEMARQKK